MHNWSKMRKTWKENRDAKKVPAGAGGDKINIGQALDKVGAAQAKGKLMPFSTALNKLDMQLKAYRTAIVKNNPKDPKYKAFAQWIDNNLAEWIEDDVKAVKQEIQNMWADRDAISEMIRKIEQMTPSQSVSKLAQAAAAAQNWDEGGGEGLALRQSDRSDIAKTFEPMTHMLDDVVKKCAERTASYGANSPLSIAKKYTLFQEHTENYRDRVGSIGQQQTWDLAAQVARDIAGDGYEVFRWKFSDFCNAVEARIG